MVLRAPGQVNVGVGRPCTAGARQGWRDRHRERMGRAMRASESFQTQREEGFPAGERLPQRLGAQSGPLGRLRRGAHPALSPALPPAFLPQTPGWGSGPPSASWKDRESSGTRRP